MKKLLTFLQIVSLLLFTQYLYAQSAGKVVGGMSSERLAHYENFINSEIENQNIAGAVSLVWRKGEVAHSKSFGKSSINGTDKMEKDQLFFIQSMTKPIITVAFMMLYEEGHFQLSDPVSKYIPEFKDLKVSKDVNKGLAGETEPMEQEITITQLLSHSAGFSHGLGSSKLDQEMMAAMYGASFKTVEERVDKLLEMPLIGQPGKQWYYSAAPDVLSVLIHKFSGMPTREFLQKRIFEPLKMNSTGYNVPDNLQQKVAALHTKNEEGKLVLSPRQTPISGNTIDSGVNGLFSTAEDYLTFCRMLLNKGELYGKRYLSRKTVELMTQNHVGDLYPGAGTGFGLGFAVTTDVSDTQELGSVGKYYWSGAFCTYFFIDPHEEMIAILMTQTAPYNGFYGSKMSHFVYQAIVD